MKKFIILLLSVSFCYAVYAQPSQKQKAISSLKQLAAQYKEAQYLSFDISYKYATQENPDLFLDSLKGSFKMNGTNYWYSLDSTEYLSNQMFTLMLFKEDKIMYLSKPLDQAAINPITVLDSVFLNDNIIYGITSTNGYEKLVLDFPAGSKNKQVEYHIDSKTGFITKMICLVQAEQLYDASVHSVIEENGRYAVVEINLNNYKEKSFDSKQFDTGKYFIKQGDEFVTTASYESYKIFLGTPNL